MIKLENQYDKDAPKVKMEISSDIKLRDLLLELDGFLRCCGYVFDGHLTITRGKYED